MALSYASKISCPKGFRKCIDRTEQIMLVANRQHIELENEVLVLTQPPLKVYGISRERLITFVYSSVDKVNDDILTAYIGIFAAPVILERIVLDIDRCFFTELNLPLGKEMVEKDGDQIRENLLSPEYKELFINMTYYDSYYSDNPILLDEDEYVKYVYGCGRHEFKQQKHDLESIINIIILQLGDWYPNYELWRAKLFRKIYDSKQKGSKAVRKLLGLNHPSGYWGVSNEL